MRGIDWDKYITSRFIAEYTCRVCGIRFLSKRLIREHIIKEHGIDIKVETCEICRDQFIPVIENQKRCGRRKCILHNGKTCVCL